MAIDSMPEHRQEESMSIEGMPERRQEGAKRDLARILHQLRRSGSTVRNLALGGNEGFTCDQEDDDDDGHSSPRRSPPSVTINWG